MCCAGASGCNGLIPESLGVGIPRTYRRVSPDGAKRQDEAVQFKLCKFRARQDVAAVQHRQQGSNDISREDTHPEILVLRDEVRKSMGSALPVQRLGPRQSRLP